MPLFAIEWRPDELNAIAAIASATTALIALFVAALTAYYQRKALSENYKLSYLQFYEIVKRHHTEEITKLRRDVMQKLRGAVEAARAKGRSLVEDNANCHLAASTLANYYESLGMFLESGWHIFPVEAREMLISMAHNSVSRTWPLIQEFQKEIHPNAPPDWAHSYRWLYERVMVYRKQRGLS